MYCIIYDNRAGNGYRFYEQTANFPEQYLDEIERVCSMTEISGVSADRVDLRYAPLRDSYLLSVIFRRPGGSLYQLRGHNTIVNFLLDKSEAEDFFMIAFDRAYDLIVEQAEQYLRKKPIFLPNVLLFLKKNYSFENPCFVPKNTITPATLLSGASYSRSKKLLKQQFIGLDENADVIQELRFLQRQLPYDLRQTISFHTGITSASESHGTALNFGTLQTIQSIVSSGYSGGANTDKYAAYSGMGYHNQFDEASTKQCGIIHRALMEFDGNDFLRRAISTWDELFTLAKVEHQTVNQEVPYSSANPQYIFPYAVLAALPEDTLIYGVERYENIEQLQAIKEYLPKNYKNLAKLAGSRKKESKKEKATPRNPLSDKTFESPNPLSSPDDKWNDFLSFLASIDWNRGLSALLNLAVAVVSAAGLYQLVKDMATIKKMPWLKGWTIQISLADAIGLTQLVLAAVLGFMLGIFIPRFIKCFRKKKPTDSASQ